MSRKDSRNSNEISEASSIIEEDSDKQSQKERIDKPRRKSKILKKPKKSVVSNAENMAYIFSKPAEEREKAEKDKIVNFLRLGVNFLRDIHISLLYLLSDKLEPVSFKRGDISNLYILFPNIRLVILKGDEATCMYLLYQGEVGVFSDLECRN